MTSANNNHYSNYGGTSDLGLSLVGMRMAPRDPTTNSAKVGLKQEVVRPDYGMGQFQQRVMKVLVKNILNI
jgi:hypothetical protein